jgi:hypothetical protein
LSGEPKCRHPLGGGLEHQSHRRAHRAQLAHVVARQDARIQVRQQPRLVEDGGGGALQVVERRRTAERGELVTCGAIAQLRLVAEREQRLTATRRGPGTCNGEHLVDREVRTLAPTRRPRERAVVADVPAQLRERDEDLGRERDETAVPLVAERTSLGAEFLERPVEQLHRDGAY